MAKVCQIVKTMLSNSKAQQKPNKCEREKNTKADYNQIVCSK